MDQIDHRYVEDDMVQNYAHLLGLTISSLQKQHPMQKVIVHTHTK